MASSKKYHLKADGTPALCRAKSLPCPRRTFDDNGKVVEFRSKCEAIEYHKVETEKGARRERVLEDWKKHEEGAATFLKEVYPDIGEIVHMGGHDWTVPDIKIIRPDGTVVWVDAKMLKAQSGQIALKESSSGYLLSEYARVDKIDEGLTQEVISFINDNGITAQKKEISVDLPEDMAYEWIILSLKKKGVFFLITGGNKIVPVDDLGKYFFASTSLRFKGQGSWKCPKRDVAPIQEILNTPVTFKDKSATFLSSKEWGNEVIEYNGFRYKLSLIEDGSSFGNKSKYEVRKLANDSTLTVSFSIKAKIDAPQGLTPEEFRKAVAEI